MNPEISRGSPGIALARPSTPIRGPGLESTRFTLISRNPSFNFNSSPNRNLNTKPQTSRTFDQASRPTARIERPRIGQINLERPNAGPLAIRERGQSAIEVAKGRARWDTAKLATQEFKTRGPLEKAKPSEIKAVEIKVKRPPTLDGKAKVAQQIQEFLRQPKPQQDRLTQLLAEPQKKALEQVGKSTKLTAKPEFVKAAYQLANQEKKPTTEVKSAPSDQAVLDAIQRSLVNLEQQSYPEKRLAEPLKNNKEKGSKLTAELTAEVGPKIAQIVDAQAVLMTGETTQVRDTFKALSLVIGKEQAGRIVAEAIKNKSAVLTEAQQDQLMEEVAEEDGVDEETKLKLEILGKKNEEIRRLKLQRYEPGMAVRASKARKAWDRLFMEEEEISGARLVTEMGSQTDDEKSPILPEGVDDGSADLYREDLLPLTLRKGDFSLVIAANEAHPAAEYTWQVINREITIEEEHDIRQEQRPRLMEIVKRKVEDVLYRLVQS